MAWHKSAHNDFIGGRDGGEVAALILADVNQILSERGQRTIGSIEVLKLDSPISPCEFAEQLPSRSPVSR